MKYLVIYTPGEENDTIIYISEWVPGGTVATPGSFIVSTREDLEKKFPDIEIPTEFLE